ncbi:NAD(P)/FAD-dependent oxidoreductase [Streptomyces sp. Ru87]|uniref:phytoene desaturase family protein n=1 Tax=Streptomyces sp. Ru87 TaxID=2044307 RepID=UPI000BFA0B4D|nr:NAD(P)/FAD-dependent oxidoreductase [Streptomyces sp. Ru87]PGH50801.1 phytoene dehydrogenase [Streptomyces sp. Ru87]
MARIAVIGAGAGAMAAAARLAVAGHRVTVHERTETYGGAVRRFERDGFAFDTGPGLLHLPAVYRDLFVKTGKEPLERCVELTQVDPASRHVFADGTALSLPNASRAGVVRALDEALGAGTGARWSDLLGRARKAWDATRRPLLEEPLRPGAGERRALGRDPYPAAPGRRWPLPRGRRPRTLAELARRELRDPRAAALLESYALGHGFDPRAVPAGAAVLPYLEQTFGSWYVRGGMRALAEALYERCRARGVEFVFGSEVTGVALDGGRAAGLTLAGGGTADADVVLSGIDARRLYGELLPPEHAAALPEHPGHSGHSRFTVLLALRGPRPEGTAHRTVAHAADRAAELAGLDGDTGRRGGAGAVTVTVLRPDDPALRPDDGHETAVLSVTVPAHAPAGVGSPGHASPGHGVDWTAEGRAERFADVVLAAAERAEPGLAERVLWRELRTPADVERETGAPGGCVPGPALAGAGGAFLRADNRAAPAGLYLAGGSAHPGGGLAHAGMSGALAAGLITHGDDWRGSE